MEVVLLPCSGRKRPGGQNALEALASLRSPMGEPPAGRLLVARKELACFIGLSPGPDLGYSNADGDVRFLPASERYDGNIYRAARFSLVWPQTEGRTVLIVSALYGLLFADDLIRDYDLKMDSTGPDGFRLYTWWKHHGLGRQVADCAMSLQPTLVHDLLSGKYRKALEPWPRPEVRAVLRQYEFPTLGMGADYARGRLLRKILEQP